MFDFVGDIFDGVGDFAGDLFGGIGDAVSGAGDLFGSEGALGGLGGLIGTVAKAGMSALMAPPQQRQQHQPNWAGVRNFGPESMSDARYAQGVKAPDPDQIAAYWYNKMRTFTQMDVK